MSSPRYATPLRLRVETSRRLQGLVLLFLAFAFGSLAVTNLSWWLKGAVALLLSLSAISEWRKRPELGGAARELTVRPTGVWLLQQGGESISCQLQGQSVVSAWFVLLCLQEREGRRRFNFILWQAEQPAQLFRRLRVYLRLYAVEALH